MKLLKASKLIYSGVLALLMGCQSPTNYHAYQPVPLMGWSGHDTLVFTPTLPTGAYEIEVSVRHHEQYPYQNLALTLSYQLNDSVVLPRDSVAFLLTDEEGKWYGAGVSSLYQFTHPEKLQLTIAQGDTLTTIYITHSMRNATLQGVTDVGLRINKVK